MTSAASIARALGGKVRGNRVVAPGPGQKPKDRSLTVWTDGTETRVHSHRGDDWRAVKDYVRERCGIAWQPTRTRKRRAPKPVLFAVRNHFLGETLAICRYRRKITFEQFALLINDLRLRGELADACRYTREFGFTSADLERTMLAKPRHYTADERAQIFSLSYAERQHLGLRRTGSVDVDKQGRERARRDRYDAKRRAARALASVGGVNREGPSSRKVTRVVCTEEKDREDTYVWYTCMLAAS